MNVVLIDSDQSFLDSFSHQLLEYPHVSAVKSFTCPESALQHIKTTVPKCVFIMPESDSYCGITLARKIKKINEDINTVFVSGSKDNYYALAAWEARATYYLTKPICREQLNKAISRCQNSADSAHDLHPSYKSNINVADAHSNINSLLAKADFGNTQVKIFAEMVLKKAPLFTDKYIICDRLAPDLDEKRGLKKVRCCAYAFRKKLEELNCGIKLRYACGCYYLVLENAKLNGQSVKRSLLQCN